MDRIVKISAEQGGEITATQNLLDFRIPNDGSIVDLSKSYLSLNFRQTTTDGTNANVADAVYNSAMTLNTKGSVVQTANYMEPVALVKHANLESQNKGFIENLRDVNVLRLNQNAYFNSEDDKLGTQLDNVLGMQGNHTWGYISPLIQANNQDMSLDVDAVGSQNIDCEHRVHLKDVFNYCKNSAHSTSQNGETRVHFEIDFSRLALDQTAFVNDAFGTGGSKEGYGQINDGASSDTLVLQRVYQQNYKEEIPYYVGMAIVTTAGTINTGAHGAQKRKITNITYNETTGAVSLKLDSTIGAGAIAGLFIEPHSPSAATFNVTKPQLVLYYRNDNPQIQNPYVFTTFSSEKDQFGNTVADVKRQYELEPNCRNMIVISKDVSESLYSDKNLLSYRVAVDNRDLTNRDVVKSSPLAYDRLNRYAMNAGHTVKNVLGQKIFRAHQNDMRSRGSAFDDIFPVFEPMPQTQNMKLVELNLVANAGSMDNIQIFKELVKEV